MYAHASNNQSSESYLDDPVSTLKHYIRGITVRREVLHHLVHTLVLEPIGNCSWEREREERGKRGGEGGRERERERERETMEKQLVIHCNFN